MVKRYNYDSKIVDLIHKIMGNGTFRAETINESILCKMMELRGTPLRLDLTKHSRDIEKDWEYYLDDLKN